MTTVMTNRITTITITLLTVLIRPKDIRPSQFNSKSVLHEHEPREDRSHNVGNLGLVCLKPCFLVHSLEKKDPKVSAARGGDLNSP